MYTAVIAALVLFLYASFSIAFSLNRHMLAISIQTKGLHVQIYKHVMRFDGTRHSDKRAIGTFVYEYITNYVGMLATAPDILGFIKPY